MSETEPAPQGVAIEMRFGILDPTIEMLQDGLRLYDLPLHAYTAKFSDVIREIYSLRWDFFTPTITVREISLSTDPAPGASPPESVWARVSMYGFGFEPGIAVVTKWNNAFGFPDNGAGANSILLQSPVPDSHGRFAFQVMHKAVKRAAKDWIWDANNQLVIVAQQSHPGGPILRQAYERFIPPHVLWQWVP